MLEPSEHGALYFSGGKDSTALLHLMEPWLDQITVLYGDTGAAYPHVRQYVVDSCRTLGVRLVIVKPPIRLDDWHRIHGLPSDIVPVDLSPEMAPHIAQPVKLQSYYACCTEMLYKPLLLATARIGANVIIRGSKKCDTRTSVPDHSANGFRFLSPLWEWTDAQVLDYLAASEVTLPKHYPEVNDSLDCWSCTAHLAHHGAERLRWTRRHYPDLWPALVERIGRVREKVMRETSRIDEVMEIAG